MAYSAKVLKVMIASPSDVARQRQAVRQVIHDWNSVHSQDRKIVLMPIGWETDASPEMGMTAQRIINRDLLKDADVLIAIFWTRLGSPTTNAPSGTVEEINEHVRAKKPTLIYFSSEPVRPDSVDNSQYEALKVFRRQCEKKGLIQNFDDLGDFVSKVTRDLARTIIKKFPSESVGKETEPQPPPDRSPVSSVSWDSLSDEAGELLSRAVGSDGVVMSFTTMSGPHVQVDNFDLVSEGDPRSAASWRGGVEELVRRDLIEDRGGKGEVFFVTAKGYDLVDEAAK